MDTLYSLEKPLHTSKGCVITVGFFDGVHLGHQKILGEVVRQAARSGLTSAAITFQQSPKEVLHPETPIQPICTPRHKAQLIASLQLDLLISLTFTKQFASQRPQVFLQLLKETLNVKTLILGHDAAFGKDREGTKEQVLALSRLLSYEAIYLDPVLVDGTIVSSTKIRSLIQQGDLESAQKFLGRRFSIVAEVAAGSSLGRTMGFPTANLPVQHLVLPPFGVYVVDVCYGGKKKRGIANLGTAPTLNASREPWLEVHIFDENRPLYQKELEVVFLSFLRPEKKFDNLQQLQEQIASDIKAARQRP